LKTNLSIENIEEIEENGESRWVNEVCSACIWS
jgi:hypothetical protein